MMMNRGEQRMMSVGGRARARLCVSVAAAVWASGVIALVVLVAGCGGSSGAAPSVGSSPITQGAASGGLTLAGVGATFPMPLYHQWADEYRQGTAAVQVVYTGGGSGFGQSEIMAGAVDFGGSDQPLSRADLESAGLMQFPTCVGGVAPIVNIDGVGQGDLRLTGPLLASIFLGEIVAWDDPAIRSVNPGLDLPDQPITVVHRSDSSGTTWIFTHYLSRVSGAWSRRGGAGTSVSWPTGEGANGNPGVSMIVASTPGAIGYTEYSYAIANDIACTQLRNRAGRWVRASLATFSAAATSAS
jgi:phosphate transport system substrate-binding protein